MATTRGSMPNTMVPRGKGRKAAKKGGNRIKQVKSAAKKK